MGMRRSPSYVSPALSNNPRNDAAHPTKFFLSYIRQVASAHRLARKRAATDARWAFSINSNAMMWLHSSTVYCAELIQCENHSSETNVYSCVEAVGVISSIRSRNKAARLKSFVAVNIGSDPARISERLFVRYSKAFSTFTCNMIQ